jgi:hypothetical protein
MPVEEKCEEVENPVRSFSFGKSRSGSSCRTRFLGLPGAPFSLNLQVNANPLQREQPLFSPEHLSFRDPMYH